MIFSAQHFIITVVIVMILFNHTFAIWKKRDRNPPKDKEMTCRDWIQHYKFHAHKVEENKKLTKKRSRKLDVEVCIWAAVYANVVNGLHSSINCTPDIYCLDAGHYLNLLPFSTLKNTNLTCEGWIYLYGFSSSDNRYLLYLNWERAGKRNKKEDKYISIWPAIYAMYLSDVQSGDVLTAAAFCLRMGKNVDQPQVMPFMTFNDTKLSCEDWINLSEYTEDIQENKNKLTKTVIYYEKFTSDWSRLYATHLRAFESKGGEMTPKEFCESQKKLNKKTYKYTFKLKSEIRNL